MDLWEAFEKRERLAEFGTSQLELNTGARHGLSLKTVQDRSIELGPGSAVFLTYSYSRRYITVKALEFDMLITLFDVNSSAILALRSYVEISGKDQREISGLLSRIKRPNLEMRVIGMQNGSSEPIQSVHKIRKLKENILAEADLFGNSTRHITIDTKTGMVYNLLLLNRIYRPGELILQNKLAPELPERAALRFIFPGETRAASRK